MAFLSKVGNILRQSTSKHISAHLSQSNPSLFQGIRCMSNAPTPKLFVGGISYQTDEQSLREAFSKYGEVVEARVITDRETGRSRGFGFITYSSTEEASSAIQALDGQVLHGRNVRVNFAAERAPRSFGGGYGGGYGSNYGGNYGGGYGSRGGAYGGQGNYGGGGYGGQGDNGGGYGAPGNYSSNFGGAEVGNQGSYGSNFGGADVGNQGSYGGNFGSDSFSSGGSGGYGSNANNTGASGENYSVAGDSGNAVGYEGGTDRGYGSVEGSESGQIEDAAAGYDQNGPVDENSRDEDDDTGDFAKRA